jgi:hypothetical protein
VLFPEIALLEREPPGEGHANWVNQARKWGSRGLKSFGRQLPADAVLRLTCREPLLAPLRHFSLVPHFHDAARSRGRAAVPARLDWVDAILFPTGVGFLLLKVGLRAERPRLGALIDLNGGLRHVQAQSPFSRLPRLRFVGAQGDIAVRTLTDFLTQGLADGVEPLDSRRFARVPYSETEVGRAYGGRCFVLSYACTDLGPQAKQLAAGAFPTGEDRVLFEYAASVPLGDTVINPAWVPSEEQAERYRRENRFALWRCWKGMVLKESLVFLGTENLSFNRKALPHNVENDYLPLYVFTLHQKFQLLTCVNSLMHEVAHPEGGLRGTRALLGRYVAFRNRYWFSEITQRPQGGELYRKLQQGLEVDRLHEAVTTSVKGAKEYYEEIHTRQVGLALNLLALVFGPLLVVFGALRMFLTGDFPLWAKGLLVSALASGAAIALLLTRKGKGGVLRWSGAPEGRVLAEAEGSPPPRVAGSLHSFSGAAGPADEGRPNRVSRAA